MALSSYWPSRANASKGVSLKDWFGAWREAFGILAEAGRGLAIFVSILTVAEAALALSILWCIKALVETLSTEGFAGPVSLQLFQIVAATILASLVSVWSNYLRIRQGILVSEVVDRRIHKKAISIEYGFYESPAYFDSLQRARQAGSHRPAQMISSALLLLKSLVFLVGTAGLIATIDWRILPALFVSIFAVLIVRLKFTKSLFNWQRSRAQNERRAAYMDMLLTSDYHAKELRLADMGPSLLSRYKDIRTEVNVGQLKIERRKALAELLVALLGAAVFAGATALLVFNSSDLPETVGNLVLFILLFRRAEISGREGVQSISKLYDDRLFLSQLFDFLHLEAQGARPVQARDLPHHVQKGLRMESVSFTYPGSQTAALTDITLELHNGKTVALVGENGSGKTTLIKLLTRLYDPSNGRITFDGIDTRDFDPVDFRRKFSVVFQLYSSYADTLRRNVAAGDMDHAADNDRIIDALNRAGAMHTLERMPDGLDTVLSRVFEGGQELSVGEWQRIAIARALFRKSDFLILDEPSSALDARAEFELFENLSERSGGRGILLISHRLSTVRMADYIYVLQGGRFIEQGTHETLTSANGKYRELFEIQARKYR